MVNGSPHLNAGFWIGEPRGHHADHGVGFGVQMNGLVEDSGISTKAALPQAPTQNDGGIRGGLIIGIRETASESGLYAKSFKQVPGALGGSNFFGKLAATSREAVRKVQVEN